MRLIILHTPILALLLGACGDDMARPGTWRATGANDANLRAMIEDRHDLRQGRAAYGERGQAGSVAIERLESGRRLPLPASSFGGTEAKSADPSAAGGSDAR